MTVSRPEDKTIKQWLTEGLTLKTVVVASFTVSSILVGSHYAMGTKIAVVDNRIGANELRVDSLQKQLDLQRDEIKTKVSAEEYLANQKQLEDDIKAIRESQEQMYTLIVERHK
jgi:hypothetical protein